MWQVLCSKEEPETVAASRTGESVGGSNTDTLSREKALHVKTRQVWHLEDLRVPNGRINGTKW
jgi:hypothetical protein